MKTINKSAPAGFDLHKIIGDDPRLRWLLDEHQKILKSGHVPIELEEKAHSHLLERAVSYTVHCADHGQILVPILGMNPCAILYSLRRSMEEVLKLFQDYGIIDLETKLDEFLSQAVSHLEKEEVERKKNEDPF